MKKTVEKIETEQCAHCNGKGKIETKTQVEVDDAEGATVKSAFDNYMKKRNQQIDNVLTATARQAA